MRLLSCDPACTPYAMFQKPACPRCGDIKLFAKLLPPNFSARATSGIRGPAKPATMNSGPPSPASQTNCDSLAKTRRFSRRFTILDWKTRPVRRAGLFHVPPAVWHRGRAMRLNQA